MLRFITIYQQKATKLHRFSHTVMLSLDRGSRLMVGNSCRNTDAVSPETCKIVEAGNHLQEHHHHHSEQACRFSPATVKLKRSQDRCKRYYHRTCASWRMLYGAIRIALIVPWIGEVGTKSLSCYSNSVECDSYQKLNLTDFQSN